MYEELVKNLRENVKDGCSDCTETAPIILQAADAIEELQENLKKSELDNINLTGWLAEEHAKHLWIPVTERLPEKYTRVLVYSKRIRLGRNIDFLNEDGDWNTIPEVSYWMPLPEPPKDGE